MDYFDLNNGEVTFTIPASPMTVECTGGDYCVPDVTFSNYGVTAFAALFDFTEGSFILLNSPTDPIGNFTYGGSAVYYSGSAADPTFTPGMYTEDYFPALGSTSPIPPSNTPLTITAVSTVTPEPGSLVLLGSGAVALGGVLRRRLRLASL